MDKKERFGAPHSVKVLSFDDDTRTRNDKHCELSYVNEKGDSKYYRNNEDKVKQNFQRKRVVAFDEKYADYSDDFKTKSLKVNQSSYIDAPNYYHHLPRDDGEHGYAETYYHRHQNYAPSDRRTRYVQDIVNDKYINSYSYHDHDNYYSSTTNNDIDNEAQCSKKLQPVLKQNTDVGKHINHKNSKDEKRYRSKLTNFDDIQVEKKSPTSICIGEIESQKQKLEKPRLSVTPRSVPIRSQGSNHKNFLNPIKEDERLANSDKQLVKIGPNESQKQTVAVGSYNRRQQQNRKEYTLHNIQTHKELRDVEPTTSNSPFYDHKNHEMINSVVTQPPLPGAKSVIKRFSRNLNCGVNLNEHELDAGNDNTKLKKAKQTPSLLFQIMSRKRKNQSSCYRASHISLDCFRRKYRRSSFAKRDKTRQISLNKMVENGFSKRNNEVPVLYTCDLPKVKCPNNCKIVKSSSCTNRFRVVDFPTFSYQNDDCCQCKNIDDCQCRYRTCCNLDPCKCEHLISREVPNTLELNEKTTEGINEDDSLQVKESDSYNRRKSEILQNRSHSSIKLETKESESCHCCKHCKEEKFRRLSLDTKEKSLNPYDDVCKDRERCRLRAQENQRRLMDFMDNERHIDSIESLNYIRRNKVATKKNQTDMICFPKPPPRPKYYTYTPSLAEMLSSFAKYLITCAIAILWCPCICMVGLCWLLTYPVRPNRTVCECSPVGFAQNFKNWLKCTNVEKITFLEVLKLALRSDPDKNIYGKYWQPAASQRGYKHSPYSPDVQRDFQCKRNQFQVYSCQTSLRPTPIQETPPVNSSRSTCHHKIVKCDSYRELEKPVNYEGSKRKSQAICKCYVGSHLDMKNAQPATSSCKPASKGDEVSTICSCNAASKGEKVTSICSCNTGKSKVDGKGEGEKVSTICFCSAASKREKYSKICCCNTDSKRKGLNATCSCIDASKEKQASISKVVCKCSKKLRSSSGKSTSTLCSCPENKSRKGHVSCKCYVNSQMFSKKDLRTVCSCDSTKNKLPKSKALLSCKCGDTPRRNLERNQLTIACYSDQERKQKRQIRTYGFSKPHSLKCKCRPTGVLVSLKPKSRCSRGKCFKRCKMRSQDRYRRPVSVIYKRESRPSLRPRCPGTAFGPVRPCPSSFRSPYPVRPPCYADIANNVPNRNVRNERDNNNAPPCRGREIPQRTMSSQTRKKSDGKQKPKKEKKIRQKKRPKRSLNKFCKVFSCNLEKYDCTLQRPKPTRVPRTSIRQACRNFFQLFIYACAGCFWVPWMMCCQICARLLCLI